MYAITLFIITATVLSLKCAIMVYVTQKQRARIDEVKKIKTRNHFHYVQKILFYHG